MLMTLIEIVVLIAMFGGVAAWLPSPQPARVRTFGRLITGHRAPWLVRVRKVRYGLHGASSLIDGI